MKKTKPTSSAFSKSPTQSRVEMREMVMPHHANPQNTIFGGVVMSWVDIAAAMCASRHSQRPVVTVHVDSFTFKSPIKVGQHVHITAEIVYVGTTSMEIYVKVMSENPYNGDTHVATTASLTFVALDDYGKPTNVPGLELKTLEEQQLNAQALARVNSRKKLAKKIGAMKKRK